MSDEQKPDPQGKRGRKADIPQGAQWEDFYSIMSQGKYLYVPTRRLWDRDAVVRAIGRDDANIIDQQRQCQELTWAPGLPMVIPGKVILNGAWRDQLGANTFNTYCPPDPIPAWALPAKAWPWLKLGRFLFGDDAEHAIEWMAHRVQHPETKVNHGLVVGSLAHGIGKDTWLQGTTFAVGAWNWTNISARKAYADASDKNSFLRSTILQISEAHDLGEKRFGFYDTSKDWMAAPPNTLMVQDKWVVQHPIFNLVGPIITTNHKSDGLFIPPDDRRHYVMWSDRKSTDFPEGYWKKFHDWYNKNGGLEHVAAYLMRYDLELAGFDPYAPPPRTAAWHEMVSANREPAENDLRGVLAAMGDQGFDDEPTGHLPEAVTIDSVRRWCAGAMNGDLPGDGEACADLYTLLSDRGKRRILAHRFERAGFTAAVNPDAESGLYKVGGIRQTVFVRADLRGRDRDKAVADLIERERLALELAAKRGARRSTARAAR